ncbi:MAG: nickel-dependent hydrogenase large subunit [archaeon]
MAREINLNHICKIEGHAHLHLQIENNKVKQCELKAAEGARFFEALVIDKHIEDVQEIVSRICGICSSAHSVASVQGIEEALGTKPSRQQKFIREMLIIGERIRSHTTHLYFMSLPDYFNASSVLSLGPEHKSKIDDALKIISLGNKIVENFGGREMHPFLKINEELPHPDFSEVLEKLKNSKKTIIRTINLFSNLKYPQLNRKANYLALKKNDCYATISGRIASDTNNFIDDDYKRYLKESIKEYSTSKFVSEGDNPYMLGAMARININHGQLDSETKGVLTRTLNKMDLKLPLDNPYHNLICQAVEILESINRAIKLIEDAPRKDKIEKIKFRAGHGVSAVEAPRGTLFHEYKIDKSGIVTYCNIITPTAQNLSMMEADIRLVVDRLLAKNTSRRDIVDKIEKLIRAYDPCFSCSTHFLKVSWL